jgi:hypothetical protein
VKKSNSSATGIKNQNAKLSNPDISGWLILLLFSWRIVSVMEILERIRSDSTKKEQKKGCELLARSPCKSLFATA